MLRSNHRPARSPRGFVLYSVLSLVLALPLIAVGQDVPDVPEIQRQIEANGWSFEVDDTFTNSLTPEERANLRGYRPPPGYEKELERHLKIFPIDKDGLPSSIDWREVDGITPVKNQGSCGSCWAFAATAELEAYIKIYYGIETDLSEQQSVSCNPYGAGCNGGWASASYYVFQHYGAVLENCAPYQGMDPPQAPCTQNDFLKYGTITGYNSISNDVDQIKAALQYGPVCTAIDASPAFEIYGSGCYDVPGGGTNHLVLIVGYDDRKCDGAGAWIIKNSWGTDFGEAGYVNVAYGAGSTGQGVTQLQYAEPPVSVVINGGIYQTPLYGDMPVDVVWTTNGDPVNNVDIWLGVDGDCHDILVAEDVPNTGTFSWTVPNLGTNYASLVIFPSQGIDSGYGYTESPLTIIGHKTRFVSAAGSNTPPYETPATAAHLIGDAVTACTGTDTVLVVGGDYIGNVAVSSTVKIRGSWDPSFSVQDMQSHPTRLQSGGSTMRFSGDSGDFGGVEQVVFHDCVGGYSSDPTNGQHGGAIKISGASPTIKDCVFEDNRAASGTGPGYGGAICVIDGAPTIQDCVFVGNRASRGGAIGVFGASDVTVSGSTFSDNGCSDNSEGYLGGAFYLEDASLTVLGGSMTGGNYIHQGGAVAMSGGQVVLDGVRVEGNVTIGGGAAVQAVGGVLELRGTTILNNQGGGSGGGIETADTHLIFRNSRISGNSAANIGGAVSAFSASGVVENCQVDGNSAPSVGGLFLMAAGDLQVRNNLIFGNDSGGLLISGTGAVEDYNNVWNNTGGDNMSVTPGAHDLSLDPLLLDPAAEDFGLACHSPCIDAGQADPQCQDPDGSRADIGLLGGPGADFVAPAAVAGLELAELGGGAIRLTWNANAEPDMDGYVVYRDSAAVFIPSPAKALATVPHPAVSFDDIPPAGDWYYLVAGVNTTGYGGGYSDRVYVSGEVSAVPDGLPAALAIARIAPNPFNPRTTIHFDVARRGSVRMGIYDVRGHLVMDLIDESLAPGRHQAVWDGRDRDGRSAAAGVYFVRMTQEGRSLTEKMVLAK